MPYYIKRLENGAWMLADAADPASIPARMERVIGSMAMLRPHNPALDVCMAVPLSALDGQQERVDVHPPMRTKGRRKPTTNIAEGDEVNEAQGSQDD